MTRRRTEGQGWSRRRGGGRGRPRAAGLLDFGLLLLLLLLAPGSAAQGRDADMVPVWPAGTVAPAPLGPGESLRLEAGDGAARNPAPYVRFSQIGDPSGGVARSFALPDRGAGRAKAEPAPPQPAAPIHPDHAATLALGSDYLARRAAAVAALLDAPEAARAARQLDLAQLLIAQMMLAEARGVLAPLLAGGASDPADQDRARGYAAILSRLAGGPPAVLPPAWAAHPLWPALVEGHPVAEGDLSAALAALADQSRPVASAALPILFDTALSGGAVGVAAEILAAAPAGTDLEGTATLDLMRGRLALAQGGEGLAFDTFARLAEGAGPPAAEARLLLADMALSRDDPALLGEVSRLLQEGLARWRGDAAALRLRVRLARVAEDRGDLPLAVEVMAMIGREHPGTPEAALAATRLPVMTGLLAEAIGSGAMPLAEALAAVRRLDPALAGQGAWVAARAALAGRLDAAALTQAARAEYAAIGRMPHATLQAADPAVLDRVAVGHAGLLLAGGDAAGAVSVLDRHGYPRRAAAMADHAALRLRAGRTAILPDLLLGALKAPDATAIPAPEAQLALAEVALLAGQEDAALAAFARGLPLADVAGRLRAARVAASAGDAPRATRFAGLSDGAAGDAPATEAATRALLDGLAAPRRSGERLSIGNAGALITAAGTAGAAVEALLSQGDGP